MSPCTVYMISCAIEQYYLWPNGKNVFFYSSFLVMGLLCCSFVILPFSEPARVLNFPVSLSGTAHPNGSKFACLPRKVSQSTEGENTAEPSICTELLSPSSLALLWHKGCTWARCPLYTKDQQFYHLSQAEHSQAPAPLGLTMPLCWGTEANVALWAASPARGEGGQIACSSLSAKKQSTTSSVNILSSISHLAISI